MIAYKRLTIIVLALGMAACDTELENQIDLDQQIIELGLNPLPDVVYPSDNPYSKQKEELGRLLFWDPIISGEKDIACITCHHPKFAYVDALDLSIGVRGKGLGPSRIEGHDIDRVPRNSPTILNVGYVGLTDENLNKYDPKLAELLWDGREVGLEEQSKLPPTIRSEMRGDFKGGPYALEYILPRLKDFPAYVDKFEQVFQEGENSISIKNYAKAISTFERSLVAKNAPYDQYLNGNPSALTDAQKEGLILFFGKAGCGNCHNGPMLSNWNYYALGVPEHPTSLQQKGGPDVGNEDRKDFKFRTPSLRNVTLTAPYMHNGMLATLEDVIDFKSNAVSQNTNVPEMPDELVPINLTEEEKTLIMEFLGSLTDSTFDTTEPTSVPSGLNPGGNID